MCVCFFARVGCCQNLASCRVGARLLSSLRDDDPRLTSRARARAAIPWLSFLHHECAEQAATDGLVHTNDDTTTTTRTRAYIRYPCHHHLPPRYPTSLHSEIAAPAAGKRGEERGLHFAPHGSDRSLHGVQVTHTRGAGGELRAIYTSPFGRWMRGACAGAFIQLSHLAAWKEEGRDLAGSFRRRERYEAISFHACVLPASFASVPSSTRMMKW